MILELHKFYKCQFPVFFLIFCSLFSNCQTWPGVCQKSLVLISRVSLHVQEFPVPGRWVERGPQWTGSRLRHRHRGRRGRERLGSAAQAFRGHDPHLDFRWGPGSLRAHRRPHPVHKIKQNLRAKSPPYKIISTKRSVLYFAAGGKKV